MDSKFPTKTRASYRARAQELVTQAENQLENYAPMLSNPTGHYPSHIQQVADYVTALATLAQANAALAQDPTLPEE